MIIYRSRNDSVNILSFSDIENIIGDIYSVYGNLWYDIYLIDERSTANYLHGKRTYDKFGTDFMELMMLYKLIETSDTEYQQLKVIYDAGLVGLNPVITELINTMWSRLNVLKDKLDHIDEMFPVESKIIYEQVIINMNQIYERLNPIYNPP